MRRVPLRPAAAPERRAWLRRRVPLAAGTPTLAASEAQRTWVAGKPCLVCARRPVDPAHLIPRALGGCDDPECVVALCRPHHRAYDRGGLDLLPYLESGYRAELAHAIGHVGLVGALRRITNTRA